jgi:hypothetical protein
MSITDVLDEFGVEYRANNVRSNGWAWIRCPFHERNNRWEPTPHPKPRGCANVNLDTGLFRCFSDPCRRTHGEMIGPKNLRSQLAAAEAAHGGRAAPMQTPAGQPVVHGQRIGRDYVPDTTRPRRKPRPWT